MTIRTRHALLQPALAVALAACSSTTTTPPGPQPPPPPPVPVPSSYVGLFDPTSTETSYLGVHSIDSTAISAGASNGSLDRAADQMTILGQTGTINGTRTQVTLNGGGTVDITNGGLTYVAMFQAQPSGAAPQFGVVGVETHSSHMPTGGSASFSGSSLVQVIDGVSFYDLTGNAAATANFGTGKVYVTYSGLNGQRTDGISAPVAVSDVATLKINGAAISGNRFSGGWAALTSSQLAALSGNQTVVTSGGFFGPSANEVGGVNLIDDSLSGTLVIFGRFVGQ